MAIRKTKSGYQVQWYDADGRFRKQTFRGITREEAVREERKLLAARDRGEPMIDRRLIPTFMAFAATWVEEHRSGWKDSTREQYEHVITRWLRPAFGPVRVSDLGEPRVRQFITGLQDAGLSPRRLNFVVLVLRMIVRVALRRRFLREDPLAGIRPLREPRTEVDPLSPEEVDAFLHACPAYWRPFFTVAFWTGARPGELFALKWGDVDFARGVFRIRAGRYRGVEGSPKTASSVRDVDMLPAVLDALQAQRAQQAVERLHRGQGMPEPGLDYVFTTPAGRCVDISPLRDRVWTRTLAQAGLRRRNLYQTRHTFASNALAAGEAPSWVAAMLGHTTPEMLFQVYGRFIPNRTRRDGSALASRMGASVSGTPTPDLLPAAPSDIPEAWKIASLAKAKCERGDLNPFGGRLSG
jgi:integrase